MVRESRLHEFGVEVTSGRGNGCAQNFYCVPLSLSSPCGLLGPRATPANFIWNQSYKFWNQSYKEPASNSHVWGKIVTMNQEATVENSEATVEISEATVEISY